MLIIDNEVHTNITVKFQSIELTLLKTISLLFENPVTIFNMSFFLSMNIPMEYIHIRHKMAKPTIIINNNKLVKSKSL